MSDYDKSLHRHDKNRRWNHGKQRLKRYVFRRLRKTGSEGADVMWRVHVQSLLTSLVKTRSMIGHSWPVRRTDLYTEWHILCSISDDHITRVTHKSDDHTVAEKKSQIMLWNVDIIDNGLQNKHRYSLSNCNSKTCKAFEQSSKQIGTIYLAVFTLRMSIAERIAVESRTLCSSNRWAQKKMICNNDTH